MAAAAAAAEANFNHLVSKAEQREPPLDSLEAPTAAPKLHDTRDKTDNESRLARDESLQVGAGCSCLIIMKVS